MIIVVITGVLCWFVLAIRNLFGCSVSLEFTIKEYKDRYCTWG